MNIKSLFSNSATYAVANFLQRGLTFILLPLYTRYLSRSEFGAMDLLYQTVFILGLLTSAGITQGLSRGFYLENNTEASRRRLLGTVFAFLLPFSLLISLMVWFFADQLSVIIFKGEGSATWIRLTALFYLFTSLQRLPLQLMKTRQESKRYAFHSLVCFALVATLNIVFIVGMKWGLNGMILANVIGFGISGVILFPGFLKSLDINFEFTRLKPLLAFGAAMVPALMARKVLEVSDRYLLPQYSSLDELGIYVMGAKIANLLDVLVLVPFLYAWQPFFYSQSNNENAPHIFSRVAHFMLIVMGVVFLSVEAISSPLLHILGGGQYNGAQSVVSLLVLGVVFNGIQYTISPGIHLKKKLAQEAGIMGLAAAINLALNIILIPKYGRVGAASATTVSYLFYLLGTFRLSQKYYPVRYLWKRMSWIAICMIVAWFGITLVDHLVLKVGVVLAFIIAGPALDIYRYEDWKGEIFPILRHPKEWLRKLKQAKSKGRHSDYSSEQHETDSNPERIPG